MQYLWNILFIMCETLFAKNYAHVFVMPCFVVIVWSVVVDSYYPFSHIRLSCDTVKWCLNYVSAIEFYQRTKKHGKPRRVSIFLLRTWWRHQMETFFALLAICAGNSPVIGEFPAQRPVTRGFDVFFDLRLNKRISKHCEDGDLRRYRVHYDVTVMNCSACLNSIPFWSAATWQRIRTKR